MNQVRRSGENARRRRRRLERRRRHLPLRRVTPRLRPSSALLAAASRNAQLRATAATGSPEPHATDATARQDVPERWEDDAQGTERSTTAAAPPTTGLAGHEGLDGPDGPLEVDHPDDTAAEPADVPAAVAAHTDPGPDSVHDGGAVAVHDTAHDTVHELDHHTAHDTAHDTVHETAHDDLAGELLGGRPAEDDRASLALRPVPVLPPAPDRPAAAPPAAAAPAAASTRLTRRGRTVALVAAAVVVVALGAVLGYRFVPSGGGSSSTAGPAASGPRTSAATPTPTASGVAALRDWLTRNARGATVHADPSLATRLGSAGLPSARADGTAAALPGDVVVEAAGADPTAPHALPGGRTAVPVADFPADGGDIAVEQVVARPVQDVVAARTDVDAVAAAGCRAILANAAITVDPAARPAFESGRVDVRVTAVLVTLAQQVPVRVVGVGVDDDERAAGTSARQIALTGPPVDALRATASAARGVYAPTVTLGGLPDTSAPTTPDATTAGAADAVTLTWPVVADASTLTVR